MKGPIRQCANGTFAVAWSTTDPATGGRRQHTKRGFNRKEPARPPRGDSAREFLNSIVGKVTDGMWRKDLDLTVKQLLDEHWLPAMESHGLRQRSTDTVEWSRLGFSLTSGRRRLLL